jgi:hypothetical protein
LRGNLYIIPLSLTAAVTNVTVYKYVYNGTLGVYEVTSQLNLSSDPHPTASGACGINWITGSTSTAGMYTLSGNCAGTILTFTFNTAAPHYWTCNGQGVIPTSDTAKLSSLSSTSVNFTVTGSTGDYLTYQCTPF